MRAIQYKPEIDGLRAIAVLAVVLFHFQVSAFSGGFVGVDIFFVISGYLITSIIVDELGRGAFSFRDFYSRRARRILPASLMVCAAVAMFGWLKIYPSDLVVLGESLVATVFFASNFFFLGETDYFGAESHTLHLLHTWSLAVEEQFYLCFPLLMFALRKAAPTRVFWTVASIAGVSVVLSLIGTWQAPAETFYMLPSRAWELLAGALIALRPPQMRTPLQASALMLFGFVLLGIALFVVDGDTPFPGIAAFAPTIGAASIIVAGPHAAPLLRFSLANPIMVGIGKISYSMYLWHWPMAVIFLDFKDSGYPAWALLAPLFSLSYLSYRFVEKPFRDPQFLPVKPRLALAFGVSAALAVFGVVAIETHGMVFYSDTPAARILDVGSLRRSDSYGASCFHGAKEPWSDFPVAACLTPRPGQRTVLLWGDSLAAHYSIGLKLASVDRNIQVLQATQGSCPAGLGEALKRAPHCKEQNEGVLDYVRQTPPDLILLSGNWHSHRGYKESLQKLIDALSQLRLRVLVLGPAIRYSKRLPDLLVDHMRANKPFVARDFLHRGSLATDSDFKKGAINLHGARLISLYDLVCIRGECPTLTPDGSPMQWDTHHLSHEGSILVGKKLMPLIEDELNRPRPRSTASGRHQR